MRVDTALLCDAATVREGLLHILGGGITRMGRSGPYPVPMGVVLAMRLRVHPTEVRGKHSCQVMIQSIDGEPIADMTMEFGGPSPAAMKMDLDPGEEITLPLLLPLQGVGIPRPGSYSLEILVDGSHQTSLPFRVSDQPSPPAQ